MMLTDEKWTTVQEPPAPGPGEIHVWRYLLEGRHYSTRALARYEQALSPHEQQRHGRIASAEGKTHYLTSHGVMRAILASYLEIDPGALHVHLSALGKPFLHPEQHKHPVQFNLSHSHGMALLAVARDFEVGVDIEQMRPSIAYMKLAARYFSSTELQQLQQQAEEQQQLAFYMSWARKEALVKASGKGIARGLHDFEVPVTTQHVTAPVQMVSASASSWMVSDLPPTPGYVAAVAGNTNYAEFRYLEWEPD